MNDHQNESISTTPAGSPRLATEPLTSNRVDVIFVDLDGTLIATDLLHEALIDVVRGNIYHLFNILLWLANGPLTLKNELSKRTKPTDALPFRDDLLKFLLEQREQGVRIVLATASHREWADLIARELGFFDDVIATDANINLKGKAKLSAIQQWLRQHGCARWAYVGNDSSDLIIWKNATVAYAVGACAVVICRLQQIHHSYHVFPNSHSIWREIVRSLRPHQWVKNLLLFVPLITGHKFNNPQLMFLTSLSCVAFCCAASSIYLVNDLLDLQADRQHPLKRHRPFASGSLPVIWGPYLLAFLGVTTLATAWLLSWEFRCALLLYIISSLSYAFWLKSKPMIDVILLASLYTLRVIAGGAASGVTPSEWLLAFSMFMFTSLAFAKRYTELDRLRNESRGSAAGRGYLVQDLALLETLGTSSGYLSVLVLALYIQSPNTHSLYSTPRILWLLCPLIMYWISRLWLIAQRGFLNEDPVVFSIRDPVSLTVFALSLVVLAVATFV